VQVLDQEQDAGSGVGASDADVEQLPAVAQGDEPGVVNAVGADAVVGVGGAVAGDGLGPGGVGGGGGCAAGERAVRAAGVVDAGEGAEQGLELGEGGGLAGSARRAWSAAMNSASRSEASPDLVGGPWRPLVPKAVRAGTRPLNERAPPRD
jgi:hypothetical protein